MFRPTFLPTLPVVASVILCIKSPSACPWRQPGPVIARNPSSLATGPGQASGNRMLPSRLPSTHGILDNPLGLGWSLGADPPSSLGWGKTYQPRLGQGHQGPPSLALHCRRALGRGLQEGPALPQIFQAGGPRALLCPSPCQQVALTRPHIATPASDRSLGLVPLGTALWTDAQC